MPVFDYMKGAYASYGKYTLEKRAIPDFRDGLKPVHRRTLWAGHDLGMHGRRSVTTKSARIVGKVIGEYHPHGDEAAYQALVGMVHTAMPMMYGQGNFGGMLDKAGASRYTEASLSRYSDEMFFDRRYMPVMERVPNYDGKSEEPLVLPSVLPNLLLNGSYGIATGATSSIPAFALPGVAKLTKVALRGHRVSPERALKELEPVSPEGGSAYLGDDDSQNKLLSFYEKGVGTVYWIPDVELNIEDRSVLVKGFAPSVARNLETSLAKVEADEFVSSVDDESDIKENAKSRLGGVEGGMAFRITLKRETDDEGPDDVEDRLWKIASYFEAGQGLSFTVTERKPPEEGSNDVRCDFRYTGITDFFRDWAEWRLDLELRALEHEKAEESKQLARDELMLLAVDNLQVVFRALKRRDSEAYLVQELEISREDAASILDMRVRSLKALNADALAASIEKHKSELERLEADLADPVPTMAKDIDKLVKALA